jgi:hypothetical protein
VIRIVIGVPNVSSAVLDRLLDGGGMDFEILRSVVLFLVIGFLLEVLR